MMFVLNYILERFESSFENSKEWREHNTCILSNQ